MKKNLTIIITTFNSSSIIQQCLKKLNFEKYKVIIVDNGSSDNTIKIIENNFPKAKLIKLDKNNGYGRANNVALKQTETEYALILNPDAGIDDKSIETVLKIMDENKDVALAGPAYEKINQAFIQTDFIEGAIVFFKMEIFKQIGFFDENFFLYYEDQEICHRVIKNNYKNIAVANLNFFHLRNKSYQPNLRNIYRSRWHLRSWSKIYYKEITEGKFKAKLLSIWLTFFYFIKILQSSIRFNLTKTVSYIAAVSGAFSFLIGLKAFKKDGTPRG